MALKFIKNYLTNRTVFVSINDTISQEYILSGFGVPQGSVLGPLLFIIYVNDLNQALSHSHIIQYADDTTIINSGLNIDTVVPEVNLDLSRMVEWFNSN